MKKRGKRLLAITLVMLMALSTITGWATGNEIEIVSVTVSPGAECTGGTVTEAADETPRSVSYTGDALTTLSTAQADNIKVTPADTVTVVVKLKEGETVLHGQEATFLSATLAGFGGELGNANIQYVDQQTTADDGTATFTFRPRVDGNNAPTQGGENAAKMGGTGVEAVKEFNYMVKAADLDMTIGSLTNNTFVIGKASAAFTAVLSQTGSDSAVHPASVSTVTLGGTAIVNAEGQNDKYSYDSTTGTLTITAAALNTALATTGSFNLVVTAPGYKEGSYASAVTVQADVVEVMPDDVTTVEGELDDIKPSEIEKTETSATVTMPPKAGDYAITYKPQDDATFPSSVSIEGEKLVLDTTKAPFAKVEVYAYVGTKQEGDKTVDVQEPVTVYIIPEPDKVGYGNVGLHLAEGEGGASVDAFAFDADADEEAQNTAFRSMVDDDSFTELVDRAEILNLAINGTIGTESGMPHFAGALDYDQDGYLALAEYRIYKLMMDGNDEVHTFSNVNKSRQAWINKAEANN